MRSIEGLDILNDRRVNQEMLRVLPTVVVGSWGRKVHNFRSPEHSYPLFSDFVDFIVKEAKIVNDPLTFLSYVKGKNVSKDTKKNRIIKWVLGRMSQILNRMKKSTQMFVLQKIRITQIYVGTWVSKLGRRKVISKNRVGCASNV